MRYLGAVTSLLVAAVCAGAGSAAELKSPSSTHSTSSLSHSSSAPSASPCAARQLTAAVESSSGAAGTVFLRVAIRNFGARCSLDGYPQLRLWQGTKGLPTRTQHGGLPLLGGTSSPVELGAPEDRAYLVLAYFVVPETREHGCPGSSGVKVWMPGWRQPLAVPAMIAACRNGLIRTSPFLRAAGAARSPGPTAGATRSTAF